jgi:Ribbon-helix-helix domain
MKSAVIRRHIRIDGYKTSITLEDAFWSGLKEIAQAQGASVAQTVKEIDGARRPGVQPLFRNPGLRTRPAPFKSGSHRTGNGSR